LSNIAVSNNQGSKRREKEGVLLWVRSRSSHIYDTKVKTSLVWFDAPFHEESEYGLRFFLWSCLSELSCEKPFVEIVKKNVFWPFRAFSILSLAHSK